MLTVLMRMVTAIIWADKTVADVRVNRDPRLSIFLKEPGQKNILFEVDNNEGTEVVMEEPYPALRVVTVSVAMLPAMHCARVVHSTVSIMPMAVVIRQLYVSVQLRLC